MQREGINPENVQMSDILCDFCLNPWTEDALFIEGHQGSVICGKCLSIANLELQQNNAPNIPDKIKCTLCLEVRQQESTGWNSPVNEKAWVCTGCVNLAIETIEKDPDITWE